MRDPQKSAKRPTAAGSRTYEGFSDEERAAMKDRAQELKSATRRGPRADKAADGEADVLAKIAEMQDASRRTRLGAAGGGEFEQADARRAERVSRGLQRHRQGARVGHPRRDVDLQEVGGSVVGHDQVRPGQVA